MFLCELIFVRRMVLNRFIFPWEFSVGCLSERALFLCPLSDVDEEQRGGAERRLPRGEGRGRRARPADGADEAERCGRQPGGRGLLRRRALRPAG